MSFFEYIFYTIEKKRTLSLVKYFFILKSDKFYLKNQID